MTDVKCPSVERIREELFTGGFHPMSKTDFASYADAEPGSLICNLKVGRFTYDVIFSPAMGDVQIFHYAGSGRGFLCWELDMMTGISISL